MSNFREIEREKSSFCWFFIIAHFLTSVAVMVTEEEFCSTLERRFLAKQMSLFIFVTILFSGWSNFALIIMMSRPFFFKNEVLKPQLAAGRLTRRFQEGRSRKLVWKVVILID